MFLFVSLGPLGALTFTQFRDPSIHLLFKYVLIEPLESKKLEEGSPD